MATGMIDKAELPIFFKKLQEVMLRIGLDKAQLAKMAGISPATVTRWSQGVHPPTSSTIDKIAKALGCPKSWLLGEGGKAWVTPENADREWNDSGAGDRTNDADYYSEIIFRLDAYLKKNALTITEKERSKLVTSIFRRYVEGRKMPNEMMDEYFFHMLT